MVTMNRKTIKNRFFFVLSLGMLLFAAGCSDEFEKMEAQYNKGNYLVAIEQGARAVQNPKLRPKVEEFLNTNGEDIYRRLFLKSSLLEKRFDTDDGIKFLLALRRVTEALVEKEISTIPAQVYLDDIENRLYTATEEFVWYHYKLGVKNFEEKRFRTASDHFEKVTKYSPDFENVIHLKSEADQASKRRISITPFFREADPITESVTRTLSAVLYGARQDGYIDIPVVIDGIDVTERFNRALLDGLNTNKSEYLTFSQEFEYEPIKGTQYYIEGRINAYIREDGDLRDVEYKIGEVSYAQYDGKEKVWSDRDVTYELYTEYYRIEVNAKASIFFTSDDTKVTDLTVTEVAEEKRQYRSDPYNLPTSVVDVIYQDEIARYSMNRSDFNRQRVIFQAAEIAANELSKKILNVLDQEDDPYSKRIAVTKN